MSTFFGPETVLETEDGLFIEQSNSKHHLEESLKSYRKNDAKHEYKILLFGVAIHQIDPTTHKIIKWTKSVGFSIWKK